MASRFYRRPQFVVAMALVVLFVLCDLGLGYLLIDGVPYAPNRYYHHGFKPNLSSEARWGQASYRVTTDSLALRDTEARTVPPVGPRRRMLILGDSFVDGVGIPYEQTFVGVIADRLKRAGDDTEVFNGGVSSHSPRLYLLHLQDLIERQGAKFDEVVVFIDVSDIQDELVYEDFVPGQIDLSLAMRSIKQFAEQNSLIAHVVLTQLPALRPLIDKARSWMRSQASAAEQPALATLDSAKRPSREVWDNADFYKNRDAWIDSDAAFNTWGAYGMKLARDNLRQLVRYAAGKGMTVSFAIYPWPRFARQPDNRAVQLWRAIAAEEKWTLADLYPAFAAVADPAKLYIPGDVHWNVDGHRFVGETWLARTCALRRPAWCARLPGRQGQ